MRALVLIALLLGPISLSWSDQESLPFPEAFESPSGEFVLVVFPLEWEGMPWSKNDVNPDSEPGRLVARYPCAGLYRAETKELLWEVDWYARSADVADDGVHVVRHGPWARSSSSEAVSFLAKGKLLRRYEVRDLVPVPLTLPRSVSHLTWRDDTRFDPSAMTYEVRTKAGDTFLFDVESGAVLSVDRALTWKRVLLLLCPLLTLLSFGALFAARRGRPARQGDPSDPQGGLATA